MSEEMRDSLEAYPSSVLEKGYGVVGKLVMQDRRLHVTAKAIYSYMATFGSTSYPKIDKICYDLCISPNTYKKYMRQLVALAYITVTQQRKVMKEGGGSEFQSNIYTINIDPRSILASQRKKNLEYIKELFGDFVAESDAEKTSFPSSETVEKSSVLLADQNLTHEQNKREEKQNRPRRPNYGRPPNDPLIIQDINNIYINNNNIRTTTKSIEALHHAEARHSPVDKSVQTTENQGRYPPVVVSKELQAMAKKLHIEQKSLEKFIKNYSQKTVQEKLEIMVKLPVQTMEKIKNPTGWLCAALKEDFQDADKMRKEEEQKRRARAEEERRKRWEARNRPIEKVSPERIREIMINCAQKAGENSFMFQYLQQKNQESDVAMIDTPYA